MTRPRIRQQRHTRFCVRCRVDSIVSKLLKHVKQGIAGKCAARRVHSDISTCCSSGNGGNQRGIRLHRESCGSSVQRDARRTGEALPEHDERLPNLRHPSHKRDKGRETGVIAENRATTRAVVVAGRASSRVSGAIQHPICGLRETGKWKGPVTRISRKIV